MAKGANFERDFCRRLSLWWSGGEYDDLFWRTSNSGGRATVRAKKGKGTKNQYGDICATDPAGDSLMALLTFELKRGYNRATIHDVLDAPHRAADPTYGKWVTQARDSHKVAGSVSWALVVKRDRRDALILMPAEGVNQFDVMKWVLASFRGCGGRGQRVHVLRLSDFFDHAVLPMRS